MIKTKSLLFTVFYLLLCNPVICQSTDSSFKLISFNQLPLILLLGAGCVLLLLGLLSYTLYRNRITQKILTDQKRELENQIGQLQKNYELHNSFFSLVSHDLRNPVASLKNDFILLKSKIGYATELDMLEQDINALYLVLDNIIYWSLLQRNDLPFSPRLINLSDALNDIIEEFDCLIRLKKVTIRFDQQSALMRIDEAVILLVLRNILFYTLNVSRSAETVSVRIRQESIRTDIIISNIGRGGEAYKLLSDQGTDKKLLNQGLILSEKLINHSQGRLSINNQSPNGIIFLLSW